MKTTLLLVFSVILSPLLHAGSPSSASSLSLVVLAGTRAGEAPVSVTVPADYLALEIRIESDESDWSLKLSGIEDARRALAAAAAKESFHLKIDRALVFQTRHQKLSFSSSGGGRPEAHSDILILAPLSAQTDLPALARRIHSTVTALPSVKKTSVTTGALFLALENPERHRADLLAKIRTHLETTSKAVAGRLAYEVSGLDEPLRLRQSGERDIEVYLPFRATYAGAPAAP